MVCQGTDTAVQGASNGQKVDKAVGTGLAAQVKCRGHECRLGVKETAEASVDRPPDMHPPERPTFLTRPGGSCGRPCLAYRTVLPPPPPLQEQH